MTWVSSGYRLADTQGQDRDSEELIIQIRFGNRKTDTGKSG